MRKVSLKPFLLVALCIIGASGAVWATFGGVAADWVTLGDDEGTNNVITFTQTGSAVDFNFDGLVTSGTGLTLDGADVATTADDDVSINAGDNVTINAVDNCEINGGMGQVLVTDGTSIFEAGVEIRTQELEGEIDSDIVVSSSNSVLMNADSGLISTTHFGTVLLTSVEDSEGEDHGVQGALIMVPDWELEGEDTIPEDLEVVTLASVPGDLRVGTFTDGEDLVRKASLLAEVAGDISIESDVYSSGDPNRSSVTCEKGGDIVLQLGGAD